MKKPFKHTDLSDKICSVRECNKRIKKNVLHRQPRANLCYEHYMNNKRAEQNSSR